MKILVIAGIIIATALTVSLTETIQIADGFSAAKTNMVFELGVGETQMLTWPVSNKGDETINVQFYATGEGSELLVFEEFVTIEPHVRTEYEIFVIVPEDHPDNVEYHPELFALKRGDSLEEGVTGMIVNVQMRTLPIIKIGDSPIYTPPVVEVKDEPKIKLPGPKMEEEKIETLEEKLERIKAANLENVKESSITEPEIELEPIAQEVTIVMDPEPISENIDEDPLQTLGGGCLIATAAYGSELAHQVQFLREVRDGTLLSTTSGATFMTVFNQFYYSFSPTIADWERENPAFQQGVKAFITPMISTLSIMSLADEGSESSVLGFGISVIALNLGLYIAAPAAIIYKLKKKFDRLQNMGLIELVQTPFKGYKITNKGELIARTLNPSEPSNVQVSNQQGRTNQ